MKRKLNLSEKTFIQLDNANMSKIQGGLSVEPARLDAICRNVPQPR